MRGKALLTGALALICGLGLNTPIQAGFVNLDTLGAAHAQSDGNWANFRAYAYVPNDVGNWAFAGAWAAASGPPGSAFGAGAGYASSPAPDTLDLEVEARVALAPSGLPGILNAYGVGYADPAPSPFLNPKDDGALNGIFGGNEKINDLPPPTQQEYNSAVDGHPVNGSNPGVLGNFDVTITLDTSDPTNPKLHFHFSGNVLLDTQALSGFSSSLSLSSGTLGIHRSFSYDESGQFTFQGDPYGTWGLSDLQITQNGSETELNPSGLDFTVPVSPGFNIQSSDLVMESIDTASASTPEPSTLTLFGTGLLGLLGYGWRRRKRIA